MLNENEIYKRIKLLGEGSFGKAYLVECIHDKSLCVIKQVDLTQMKEDERKETIKEARILEALRHPNIVRFREVYKTKKGRLCIVMDYADGGDLSNKIRQGQSLTETQILDWFTQMCLAIKHVHDRKIIHRDLKTQNIFLTQDGIIKLGDFGIARVLNHTREKCKTMVGTPYYLSPEIIESRDYSFKTDIWSLGVILYELCTLKPPFNAESLHGLALKIVRGQYNPLPDRYSTSVRQLVQSLLQVDPIRRPSIHDILKMPVIVNRIKSVLSESIRNIEFSHTILHKQKFVNDSLSVPYDNELRSVHSQPVLGKQQQQQPQNYLLALNQQRQQIPQKKPYQPSNYEYFSKQQQQQQQQNVYPAGQNRYLQKQPLQIQNNNRPNISPINRDRLYQEDRSPISKSPLQRDKSPFEIQREQVRQQLKQNDQRVQQLQENRLKYLPDRDKEKEQQKEKEVLPKLSREPYSQPQLYRQDSKDQQQQLQQQLLQQQQNFQQQQQQQLIQQQQQQQQKSYLQDIKSQEQQQIKQQELQINKISEQKYRIEPLKLEQKQQEQPISRSERVDSVRTEISKSDYKSERVEHMKSDYREQPRIELKPQKMKESQLILQEIREIKQESKDEKEKMLKFMELKKQNNEKQLIVEEEEDEASQLLQELEELVISAEGGANLQNIKQSQVIDIQDILNINIRESIDREDDDSIFDPNEEREEIEEEQTPKSTKEFLYQILIKALGQDLVNQFKNKVSQLTKNDYLNFITRDFDEQFQQIDQGHKAMLFIIFLVVFHWKDEQSIIFYQLMNDRIQSIYNIQNEKSISILIYPKEMVLLFETLGTLKIAFASVLFSIIATNFKGYHKRDQEKLKLTTDKKYNQGGQSFYEGHFRKQIKHKAIQISGHQYEELIKNQQILNIKRCSQSLT
ncbi:hypothetical protein pb186bvf_016440 [Paramecium bursaria]